MSDLEQRLTSTTCCLHTSAGSQEQASVCPNIPASAFDGVKIAQKAAAHPQASARETDKHVPQHGDLAHTRASADLFDDSIQDADMVGAKNLGLRVSRTLEPVDKNGRHGIKTGPATVQYAERLPNGNWKCRHNCKDTTKCKHVCCKEGLESKPKPKAAKSRTDTKKESSTVDGRSEGGPMVTKNSTHSTKRGLDQVDLTQTSLSFHPKAKKQLTTLQGLHEKTSTTNVTPSTKYARTAFASQHEAESPTAGHDDFEDFDDIDLDLASDEDTLELKEVGTSKLSSGLQSGSSKPLVGDTGAARFDSQDEEADVSDQEMLDAVLIGAEDSFNLSSPVRATQDRAAVDDEDSGSPDYALGGAREVSTLR